MCRRQRGSLHLSTFSPFPMLLTFDPRGPHPMKPPPCPWSYLPLFLTKT